MSELRIRDYMMDELGDPDEPVGSRLWSLWVANEIRKTLYDKQKADSGLRRLVNMFKEHQGFQAIGFLSWEEFCERKLQKAADEVDKALTPVQQAARDAKPLNENGKHASSDNYQSIGDIAGTSAEYLTARIARDRPDILDDMKAGKYRSVRQAAIEAGIVKPSQRLSVPRDPQAAGDYLAQRVDTEWFMRMVDAYYSQQERKP